MSRLEEQRREQTFIEHLLCVSQNTDSLYKNSGHRYLCKRLLGILQNPVFPSSIGEFQLNIWIPDKDYIVQPPLLLDMVM